MHQLSQGVFCSVTTNNERTSTPLSYLLRKKGTQWPLFVAFRGTSQLLSWSWQTIFRRFN